MKRKLELIIEYCNTDWKCCPYYGVTLLTPRCEHPIITRCGESLGKKLPGPPFVPPKWCPLPEVTP